MKSVYDNKYLLINNKLKIFPNQFDHLKKMDFKHLSGVDQVGKHEIATYKQLKDLSQILKKCCLSESIRDP